MQPLNLPTYFFNTKSESGRKFIFDIIRRKFVRLTPEEWVRQNFIHYLKEEKQVPQALISVESELILNTLKKRTDILIHDKTGKPRVIVECKSPDVPITKNVFDQILRYNLVFNVSVIIVTNGLQHFCCALNNTTQQFQFLKEIPSFNEMITI